jgi:hypothetical protein
MHESKREGKNMAAVSQAIPIFKGEGDPGAGRCVAGWSFRLFFYLGQEISRENVTAHKFVQQLRRLSPMYHVIV